MFTTEERDALRDRVVSLAREDPRVVGGAEVGSLSLGGGDRWSDIDLTFAVDDSVAVAEVLDDWTSTLKEWGAVVLFDLPAGPITYRVYMWPDCLQLDLSFSSASHFEPTSPRFRLIFGDAGELREPEPPSAAQILGWSVMWARHTRVCIEREQWRRAEHALASMRERALDFACRRRDLPAGYGRGLEQLPAEVYERFAASVPKDLDPDVIKRCLKECVAALAAECADVAKIDPGVHDVLVDTVAGM